MELVLLYRLLVRRGGGEGGSMRDLRYHLVCLLVCQYEEGWFDLKRGGAVAGAGNGLLAALVVFEFGFLVGASRTVVVGEFADLHAGSRRMSMRKRMRILRRRIQGAGR